MIKCRDRQFIPMQARCPLKKFSCRGGKNFVGVALTILLSAVCLGSAFAVPALDNESIVVVEVLQRTLIDATDIEVQPAQKLWRFRVRLAKVVDVAGKENFLRGQNGQTIEIYSNQVNALATNRKLITWRIRFEGDERNGRYWLIETIESKAK